MAEAKKTKTETKEAETKDTPEQQDVAEIVFPEVLGNTWHPYREPEAIFATFHPETFLYDGMPFEGGWLCRGPKGDTVLTDEEFSAHFVSIPPAKLDNETIEYLGGIARL